MLNELSKRITEWSGETSGCLTVCGRIFPNPEVVTYFVLFGGGYFKLIRFTACCV